MIKKIFSSIGSKDGSIGLSLPVRIFEPRSVVERMIDRFSTAPIFLR